MSAPVKLTEAQRRVLEVAAARESGNVYPTGGLRGGAQSVVLDTLEAKGLIGRDPNALPRPEGHTGFWYPGNLIITPAGRAALKDGAK